MSVSSVPRTLVITQLESVLNGARQPEKPRAGRPGGRVLKEPGEEIRTETSVLTLDTYETDMTSVSEVPQEAGYTKVDLSSLCPQDNGKPQWGSKENFPKERGWVKEEHLIFGSRQCQTQISATRLTSQ